MSAVLVTTAIAREYSPHLNVTDPEERFELKELIGEGGMGVVHLAHDRVWGVDVALKTLREVSPGGILRLKNEFRALAGIAHPNLVALHELHGRGERWFITMEYVDGVDPTVWVVETDGVPSWGRVRDLVAQLAHGLAALHAHGKLHRDIKPRNVKVDRNGRAVLLDFGLVLALRGARIESARLVSGTVAYMAPELGAGDQATEASDWYSLGVLLHQLLTGQTPFTGSALKMMMEKRRFDPRPPSALEPRVPPDLDALCLALLSRDPSARPPGEAVLRALGVLSDLTPVVAVPRSEPGSPLVGRDGQLAALRDAVSRVEIRSRAVLCLVHGGSGHGKTALLERFTEEIDVRGVTLVISGRCHEHESVPFKALDSVIDQLTRVLGAMKPQELAAVWPSDSAALCRVFPVLNHVNTELDTAERDSSLVAHFTSTPVASRISAGQATPSGELGQHTVSSPSSPGAAITDLDPRVLRRRAVNALRSLLRRLAARRRLIIRIDDLQWGDVDSAALIAEVLWSERSPALLLIGAYRPEEAASGEVLRRLLPSDEAMRASDVVDVAVAPLSAEECSRLARLRLGAIAEGRPKLIERVVQEAGGNPFLVEALAMHAASRHGLEGDLSIGAMIEARLRSAPDAARALLEVVAVAGRPSPRSVTAAASGVGDQEPTLVRLLRLQHLIRVRTTQNEEELEAYHDRVREAVVRATPAERRAKIHRALAMALEASGRSEPESLAAHWLSAGEFSRAVQYTARAAERAAEALAFDRAVELHQRALFLERRAASEAKGTDGGDATTRQRSAERALQVALARALAHAGRGAESGHVYLEAAENAPPGEALVLRRLAGEQLLISGQITEGLAVMEAVLGQVGLRLAKSPHRALPELILVRTRLRLRGLEFDARPESAVAADALARVDTCWAVGTGLGFVDHVRAGVFQTRTLHYALDAGEPARIARALAMEAAYAVASDPLDTRRPALLLKKAVALAERIGHPHARGMVHYGAGVSAFLAGRWREARGELERAITVFREECRGIYWEITSAENVMLSAMFQLGEAAAISARVPASLRDARERGNKYHATNLRTGYPNLAWLIGDHTDEGARELDEAMREWNTGGYHVQHYFDAFAKVNIELYRRDGRAAWERLLECWGPMTRSLVREVKLVDHDARFLRARAALAAAAAGESPARMHMRARRDARFLDRVGLPWTRAHAIAIRALVAAQEGREGLAVSLLDQAVDAYRAADMSLYAAAAGGRAAALAGASRRGQLAEAHAAFSQQGVVDPARLIDMMLPGLATAEDAPSILEGRPGVIGSELEGAQQVVDRTLTSGGGERVV